jgi:hypothetical protein
LRSQKNYPLLSLYLYEEFRRLLTKMLELISYQGISLARLH